MIDDVVVMVGRFLVFFWSFSWIVKGPIFTTSTGQEELFALIELRRAWVSNMFLVLTLQIARLLAVINVGYFLMRLSFDESDRKLLSCVRSASSIFAHD